MNLVSELTFVLQAFLFRHCVNLMANSRLKMQLSLPMPRKLTWLPLLITSFHRLLLLLQLFQPLFQPSFVPFLTLSLLSSPLSCASFPLDRLSSFLPFPFVELTWLFPPHPFRPRAFTSINLILQQFLQIYPLAFNCSLSAYSQCYDALLQPSLSSQAR